MKAAEEIISGRQWTRHSRAFVVSVGHWFSGTRSETLGVTSRLHDSGRLAFSAKLACGEETAAGASFAWNAGSGASGRTVSGRAAPGAGSSAAETAEANSWPVPGPCAAAETLPRADSSSRT